MNTVLSKESRFRFRMNIVNLMTGDQPYDAFHGLQRANEELMILKVSKVNILIFSFAMLTFKHYLKYQFTG